MYTLPLGQTGEQVSALCLGAMYFGTSTDAETSMRLLDQYAEAGGTFIDTANIYAHWVPRGAAGESERLLGRWLRERDNRAQMFIASKVGFEYPGIERGLRAGQIAEECEKSLRLLGVDTIDLYYAHVDDRHTPLEETLTAFDRLVRDGKIRYVGASNFAAWRLEAARCLSQAHGWPAYCCVQQRYSYLRPAAGADTGPQVVGNAEMLDYCRSRQITMLAYTALMRGAYAGRPLMAGYAGPDTGARLAAVAAVAAETEATPNQVALAWLLQGDPPVLPLAGVSTTEQLAENLVALELRLSPAQMERLNCAGA